MAKGSYLLKKELVTILHSGHGLLAPISMATYLNAHCSKMFEYNWDYLDTDWTEENSLNKLRRISVERPRYALEDDWMVCSLHSYSRNVKFPYLEMMQCLYFGG